MAWTNFVITIGLVGSVAYLMKTDVRRGSTLLRQNLKTIRGWLEEEGPQASKTGQQEVKKISEQVKSNNQPKDSSQ